MSKLISNAVDRGLEVRQQIKKLQAELKEIETLLEATGLKAEHTDLKDADREGRRWLATGSEVCVPVIFTADKIVASFTKDSKFHRGIIAKFPESDLRKFYKPAVNYEGLFKDGKQFRAAAANNLHEYAPLFITACLARDKNGVPKSDVKILWDETEVVP